MHLWYDHCSVCVDFVCYTQCVTCIYVLCTLSVLHEFYLYFVSVLYCVCCSCVLVSVCVLGELGQIVTAEPKKKGKEVIDTLATYPTFKLHVHPWRLQTALIMRLSMKDDVLNALGICVMCGSACMHALTHIKC